MLYVSITCPSMHYTQNLSFIIPFVLLTFIYGHVYLAPNGKDKQNCTFEEPCATLQHAIQISQPDDSIILLRGTYKQCFTVQISKLVRLRSYNPSTKVVLHQGECFPREEFFLNVTSDIYVDGITFHRFDRVFL